MMEMVLALEMKPDADGTIPPISLTAWAAAQKTRQTWD
jgi:hypothetical protein